MIRALTLVEVSGLIPVGKGPVSQPVDIST